jgi:hypothetical protein
MYQRQLGPNALPSVVMTALGQSVDWRTGALAYVVGLGIALIVGELREEPVGVADMPAMSLRLLVVLLSTILQALIIIHCSL